MSPVPIDIIVKATAIVALAAVLDAASGRRASAATRHFVWSLAIAALLLLPFASLTLPAWHVSIPVPRAAAAPSAGAGAVPSSEVAAPDTAPRAAPVPSDAEGPRQTRAPAPPRTAAIVAATVSIVYAMGVGLLVARFAFEPFALRRLTRESREVTHPAWRGALADAAEQLRVRGPVRLLQSARDVMPLTFGTLAPTIVMPASAREWTEDRRRAVLLHELAHVARRDCLIQQLTAFACALYWPHPGVWWAARRLRAERELACDDRVLAAGAPARAYAGHLLDLAHSLRAAPAPVTALGMARAHHLERRLLAILDAARNRATPGGRGRIVVVTASIAVLLPLAALRAALVPVEPSGAAPPASSAAASGQDLSGTWEIRPSGDPGTVQLSVRTAKGSHGRTVPLAEVQTITGGQISAGTNGPVHFPIKREAGTFTIDGVCRTGVVCAGTYGFEPSAAFAAELQKRGIGRPAPAEQLDLAIADVGAAYLDALAAGGYTTPDVRLLVRAAQHGVDLGYLKDMTGLGYRVGTIDHLIRLRDHGVDPAFIRGLEAQGIKALSADELVRTRDHGVDPEYIRGLASLGFTGLTVDALVEARDHGIDPAYIGGMQASGYKQSLADLRRTRDHGVDPEYVRGLSSLGYTGLTVDALVGARDHGVDPSYVREMAELGYKSVPLNDLVRMRDHGVDPQYVRRLKQQGVSNLSVDELVRRRDRGQ